MIFLLSKSPGQHCICWWPVVLGYLQAQWWPSSALVPEGLTHWGQDKMVTIFQTTYSNEFCWIKIYEFRIKYYLCLFLVVQLTISQHWFRWWLGAGQMTSHYLNQCWLFNWCIYALLSLSRTYNILTMLTKIQSLNSFQHNMITA